MSLHLKHLKFDIASATIMASLADPYWCDTYNGGADKELSWFVDVMAQGRTIDDQNWQPNLYHQSLRFPIRDWRQLSGQIVSWDAEDETEAGFYVFEHEDIPRATLRIGERDGARFRLECEGICNVFWNDEFGQDVPFSLATTAEFTGVTVHGSETDSDETLRQRLSRFLDLGTLVQQPIHPFGGTYESGVAMMQCRFEPRL